MIGPTGWHYGIAKLVSWEVASQNFHMLLGHLREDDRYPVSWVEVEYGQDGAESGVSASILRSSNGPNSEPPIPLIAVLRPHDD